MTGAGSVCRDDCVFWLNSITFVWIYTKLCLNRNCVTPASRCPRPGRKDLVFRRRSRLWRRKSRRWRTSWTPPRKVRKRGGGGFLQRESTSLMFYCCSLLIHISLSFVWQTTMVLQPFNIYEWKLQICLCCRSAQVGQWRSCNEETGWEPDGGVRETAGRAQQTSGNRHT